MSNTLDVRVFQVFFDQIEKGVKTTEYREMSDYWMHRLVDTSKYGDLGEAELRDAISKDPDPPYRPFSVIRFHCGGRTLERRITGIRTYPCHDWFAIKLGKSGAADGK